MHELIYTVSIPVEPFVQRYLVAKFGSDTIKISLRNNIGRFLYQSLERTPTRIDNLKKGQHLIHLLVGPKYAYKGLYITQGSIDLFNRYIYDEIVSEMFTYIENFHEHLGMKYNKRKIIPSSLSLELKQVIYGFLNKYSIDEKDLTYDRLKQNYQRNYNVRVAA